jgi:hypothetical protein
MFRILIIARSCRFALIALVLAAAATGACKRVPLLAPTGSTITLTALATTLPFNGSSQLIAQVVESSGTPPQQGTHVIFTTTLGTIQPSEVETDISGRAVTTFVAGTGSGIATISASSGSASGGGTATTTGANIVKIAIGAAAVGSIAVSASPGTVSGNGGSSTISARIGDTAGNALPSVPVTFSTDNGSLNPSIATTDATGVASTTLTTNKTAKVTATAGIAGATGGSGSTGSVTPGTVTVNVNTPNAINVTGPTAAVVAGQVANFTIGYSSATGTSPISRIVVDWGDNSQAATFSGAPTGVSHTYNAAGSFLVRVTATDTFGDVTNGSASVTVSTKPVPIVSIIATGTATAGAATTFTIGATVASTSTALISDVRVDFGDGSPIVDLGGATGTNLQVQHIYQQSGTYQASVVAVDTNGSTGSASTVFVVGALVIGLSTSQSTPPPGTITTVLFTVTVNPPTTLVVSYAWTFGDGTTATTTTATTSHGYPVNSGLYNMSVTITSASGLKASASTVITP